LLCVLILCGRSPIIAALFGAIARNYFSKKDALYKRHHQINDCHKIIEDAMI
jgi:hypothetical protein